LSEEVTVQAVQIVFQICFKFLVRRIEILQGPVACSQEALNAGLVCLEEWLAEHIDTNFILFDQLVDLAVLAALSMPRRLAALQLIAGVTEIVSLVARHRASGDVCGSSSRDRLLPLRWHHEPTLTDRLHCAELKIVSQVL
jgi:hypothetical protein